MIITFGEQIPNQKTKNRKLLRIKQKNEWRYLKKITHTI